MAVHRIQGILFILFGLVACYDSWRIIKTIRPTGNFDAVGPDHYLVMLSALMILLGLGLALRPRTEGMSSDWSDVRRWPPAQFLVVIVVMATYTWAIPKLGFSISTLLFFVALYRLLGEWSWPRVVLYAFITTATTYVIFIYGADMSLPKSFFGI